MQTLNISEARQKLLQLVKTAQDEGESFTVTVKGKPAVVILSTTDYESIMETLEVLTDTDLMRAIIQGEKDISRGQFVRLEDL